MTAILSLQSNTIYFEQFVRQQLETQEAEMRDQLKLQESEVRDVKASKIKNDGIVEELRPLCEELPPDALDPVTMEPFNLDNIPGVFKCGHVLNRETIRSLVSSRQTVDQGNGIGCPVCKSRIYKNEISECVPLEGVVEHLQKITKVFKEISKKENVNAG